jgi:hypothetical protein
MEHGHGNHSANDWASTAYWYQTLPGVPFGIPPVAERLPIRLGDLGVLPMLAPGTIPAHPGGANAEMQSMSARHRQKVVDRDAATAAESARLWSEAQQWSQENTTQARDVRRRWLGEA